MRRSRRLKFDQETLRITPNPTVRQYHASIMHDIMIRNPFPQDTIDMAKVLSLAVKRTAEAEAILLKAKADIRRADNDSFISAVLRDPKVSDVIAEKLKNLKTQEAGNVETNITPCQGA